MNWLSLAANALWILGCALALAALSHASWQASLTRRGWREAVRSGRTSLVLHSAELFFCAGLAFTSPRLWEAVLWAILGFGVLLHFVLWRRDRSKVAQPPRLVER